MSGGFPSVVGIHESSLYVADLDRSAEFYRTIFGFRQVLRHPERHVILQAGRDALLLFDAAAARRPSEGAPPHGGKGELHVAFEIPADEVDVWRERLVAHGVSIEREITWPGGQRSLYVRDPDRHSVELVVRGLWGF